MRDAWLTDLSCAVHAASYGNYGAKRVHSELVLRRRIRVGPNAVAMLMHCAEIVGRSGARKRRGVASSASIPRGDRRGQVVLAVNADEVNDLAAKGRGKLAAGRRAHRAIQTGRGSVE